MIAHVARPLTQWLRWQRRCCSATSLHHILFHLPSTLSGGTRCLGFSFPAAPSSTLGVHFRTRGPKLRNAALEPSNFRESDGDDTDSDGIKKSRNERKREARRSVQWGKDLAAFSTPQIKRILGVLSLDREVFDAIMLVKRFGPDVREGKRRQFNYIGRLLREAEPKLMDDLIEATKVGNTRKLQALCGSGLWISEDGDEETEETESEDEEEASHSYMEIANRWFDGLINKDISIAKEIYSVNDVDFDRQELRRLVNEVHSMQDQQLNSDEEEQDDAALIGAKRSLTRFLRALAKQLPEE